MNPNSTKSTWSAIAAGALVVGGITYYTLQPVQPTMTIEAVYAEQDKWEIPELVFEWSYKTNLNGPWKWYATVTGTNTLTVPTKQFAQGFFTITKIMRKGFTNVFIVRTNQ